MGISTTECERKTAAVYLYTVQKVPALIVTPQKMTKDLFEGQMYTTCLLPAIMWDMILPATYAVNVKK